MKKSLILVLAFFILTSSVPFSLMAETTNIQSQIDAVQKQRDQLLLEQKQLQSQLYALGTQSKSLTGNIKTLDATKKKLLTDLKVTQNGISSAGLQIDKLASNINQKQNEISRHESAISSAMKQLSGYDAHTVVYDLLAYENISDVWTDTANLSSVQDKLQSEIAQLKDTTDALAKNKADEETQKLHLASLATQLNGQKKVVENTQSAKVALLTQTKSQEAQYQMLLAQNIAREKEFEAQLFLYESQLKAASTGSAPAAEHSILSWPLDRIRVSQQFGRTSSSGRLYASGTHNGVDFSTPVGSAVRTVRSGVIKAQGNTDSQPGCYSYGRWILIEHDNGLSTIYGHLSATLVTTGQAITTGTIIGYSGGQPGADGAGYSTGPHLHLGLFVSAGVTVQRYSNSINCKNTSIPIANPTDYLDPLAYFPKL
jgi:murein DD-endopeptidase MepM/ murein hydrolase activator NlpD